jgi:hypothetical protein
MRFPVDRKPERAIQAKVRDKKMNMKKLAEIVRNSGKNERLDEPKTRKGGSCKNEVDKRQVTISGKSPSPLGASATVNDRLHQKLLYL